MKVLSLVVFIIFINFSWAEFSTQECKELGFIKTQLKCSYCDKLDESRLSEIKDHCKECCQKDNSNTNISKKYAKAILEVCTCKFGAYPQIQAFIKSDRPAKFKNLQIKYVRGLDPIVKMYDSKNQLKETLSITKWNTDTVEEFFQTHLDNNDDDGDFLTTNQL